MNWRFIDLSIPLEAALSEPEPVVVESVNHREGASLLTQGSGIHPNDFPDGMGLSLERIRLTSHSGTHVDAPLHYGPQCEGRESRSIDQMPLEWFFGPALVIDCAENTARGAVTREEIQMALQRQKLAISPRDIVFIHTGADRLWGNPEYFTQFRGVTLEATEWLLDQGVRVIGVDSFGFDTPFHKMIQLFLTTKDPQSLWPCHVLGRNREYCQIERLANLALLPKTEKFIASCFPIKLKGCGAGPSRVVALISSSN